MFLHSVQSNEEYEQTEAVCKDFLDKDALKFHVPLVKKAKGVYCNLILKEVFPDLKKYLFIQSGAKLVGRLVA